jgi:hypothetical protein
MGPLAGQMLQGIQPLLREEEEDEVVSRPTAMPHAGIFTRCLCTYAPRSAADVTRCSRGRDSLSTQVRDNAIGALARMLQGVPGAIPVGDILALVVDHFPLQVRVIS